MRQSRLNARLCIVKRDCVAVKPVLISRASVDKSSILIIASLTHHLLHRRSDHIPSLRLQVLREVREALRVDAEVAVADARRRPHAHAVAADEHLQIINERLVPVEVLRHVPEARLVLEPRVARLVELVDGEGPAACIDLVLTRLGIRVERRAELIDGVGLFAGERPRFQRRFIRLRRRPAVVGAFGTGLDICSVRDWCERGRTNADGFGKVAPRQLQRIGGPQAQGYQQGL